MKDLTVEKIIVKKLTTKNVKSNLTTKIDNNYHCYSQSIKFHSISSPLIFKSLCVDPQSFLSSEVDV